MHVYVSVYTHAYTGFIFTYIYIRNICMYMCVYMIYVIHLHIDICTYYAYIHTQKHHSGGHRSTGKRLLRPVPWPGRG